MRLYLNYSSLCELLQAFIFNESKSFGHFTRNIKHKYHKILAVPTADTIILNREAQNLLSDVYRSGYLYKKCGIELHGLNPLNRYRYGRGRLKP